MTILDRANAFIGHEQEVDEGYETTMRRNAFIAGFKEALELVREMRDAQKKSEHQLEYDFEEWNEIDDNKDELESEVDELLKEMEEEE